jgi:hypothetical protein
VKNEYAIRGDHAVIFAKRKGVTYEVLVSTEDLEIVKAVGLSISIQLCLGKLYASQHTKLKGKQITKLLHRTILNAPNGLVVDHINGDTLDNRSSNLRVVTQSANIFNRQGATCISKTGIRGVSKTKSGSFAGDVKIGKERFRKVFKTIEEATAFVESTRRGIEGRLYV